MNADQDSAQPLLTVVILTKNEAMHIVRCLDSIRGLRARIVVVDSGSTDETCALARAGGAEVLAHGWTNYATQFNWALDNAGIDTAWTMRLDADEVVSPELHASIAKFLAELPAGVAGASVDRAIHFMGRTIRHGGVYPVQMVRLWRSGLGRVESRWMDEHLRIDGPIRHLTGDLTDINLNSIGWWTEKHNGYATREAIDQLIGGHDSSDDGNIGGHARRKRWIKTRIYARLPLGLRPLLFFLYRYILRAGFLDGWQGLVFHALQTGWYRFLVDVKMIELRDLVAARGISLAEAVHEQYGIRIDP